MIVVTGASSGLGEAITKKLVQQGEKVIGIARSESPEATYSFKCDVGSHEDLMAIAREIRKSNTESSVKGLVNAAGVASMNLALFTPPEVSDRIMRTNFLGTLYACQAFSPLMIRQGHGRIINFSSIAVSLGLEGESIYAASKAAVETFTRILAKELSSFGINVNCVSPGPIDTPILKGVDKSKIKAIVNLQTLPKHFSKEEVADLVFTLLGENFASVSGQTISIGGS